MTATRVLIIDDEIKLVRSISFALRQAGFDCLQSHSGAQGLEIAEKQHPDLVLLDVKMPGTSGLVVLQELRRLFPDLPVIMMSALDATRDAVQSVKLGALDYLSKPFDMEDLIQLIQDAVANHGAPFEGPRLDDQQIEDAMLLGNSHAIANLRAQIDKVAKSGSRCVLLQGEMGTGKSVIARELHERSCGPHAPLIELNCAALAQDQGEAELFGQEAGPNNKLPRCGLVEIADGGTLFLHEIEALSLTVQTRLMVFLETGSLRPMAAKKSRLADVKLIVSTHSDFKSALKQQLLRQGLHLKITALPLMVPPLRDRAEDIELLALSFIQKIAHHTSLRPIKLSRECLGRMQAYEWPGNVRELKNMIERLTVLHPGEMIGETALPNQLRALDMPIAETIEDQVRRVERDLVLEALAKARGHKGRAAEKLGISRHALKRKMQKLGI